MIARTKADIKAVFLDYDGVIVNSFPTCFQVHNEIAKRLGVKQFSSLEEFRRVYRFTHHDINRHWGLTTPEQEKEISRIYREETAKLRDGILLVPGIKEVIEELARTHKLAITSGTSRELITERLRHYDLLKYFSIIVGVEDVKNPKPAPDAALVVLEKLGVKKEDAVYMGDMVADISFGRNTGIRTVILCGPCSWNDVAYIKESNPDAIIEKPEQLLTMIQ